MTAAKDKPKIGIVGGGRLAQAMAAMLGRLPGELSVWSRKAKSAANVKAVAKGIRKENVGGLVDNADILALALPAHALNAVVSELGDHARPDQLVLHGMRGVDGSD